MFGFVTIQLELEALGISPRDIVLIPVPRNVIDYYGNALLVSNRLIRDHPDAVRGLVRATNRAFREAMANPAEAVVYLTQRDQLIDPALELRRLITLRPYMVTETTRRTGFGYFDRIRVERQVDQVLASPATAPGRHPSFEDLVDARFLPPRAERLPLD